MVGNEQGMYPTAVTAVLFYVSRTLQSDNADITPSDVSFARPVTVSLV